MPRVRRAKAAIAVVSVILLVICAFNFPTDDGKTSNDARYTEGTRESCKCILVSPKDVSLVQRRCKIPPP